MKLEQIDPKSLPLEDAIKNQNLLYYIIESDDETAPYKFSSFSKEGLALPGDNYILVQITKAANVAVNEPVKVEKKPEPARLTKRGVARDYKFTGLNDAGTIQISWGVSADKYGTIRVSFPNKEDANDYHDYFREQFYNRDISSIDIASIYEDLGISKERIAKESPGAWKWGYPTLHNGPCKYITEMVTKNKNDKWYGFSFYPPVIINGMEESGWYAKHKDL